jgi:hypothetical protein
MLLLPDFKRTVGKLWYILLHFAPHLLYVCAPVTENSAHMQLAFSC